MNLTRRSLAGAAAFAAAPRAPAAHPARAQVVEARANEILGSTWTGAVLVAQGGGVVWAGGVGRPEAPIPKPTRKSVFDVLSIGKTFTALALMRLVDLGRLDLSQPIRKHLPELPESFADIKIRHALNQDTGLPVYLSGDDFTPRDHRQALAEILTLSPERKGGGGYRYSNVNYQLLGLLLQRVTGADIHGALRDLVFKPAGLLHTGFFSEPRWSAEPVASGWVDGVRKGSPADWPDTWSLLGAAGIASTVDDLYRLNRAFMAGPALSPGVRARLLHPGAPTYGRGPYLGPDNIDISYGAGLYHWLDRAGRHVVFHGGDGDYGFQALMFWREEDDVFICCLMNSRRGKVPFDRSVFVQAMLAAVGG